jgi:hypothetical protein
MVNNEERVQGLFGNDLFDSDEDHPSDEVSVNQTDQHNDKGKQQVGLVKCTNILMHKTATLEQFYACNGGD